jgi:hypothetical protein
MTASDEPAIAVESCDQAFARAHSAYGCHEAPSIRKHDVLERAVLVKKRAGFVGAFDRDSDDQVRVADSAQARLEGTGIVQWYPHLPAELTSFSSSGWRNIKTMKAKNFHQKSIGQATEDCDNEATTLSSRESMLPASFSVGTTSANLWQSGSTGIPLKTSVPELAAAFK